MEDTQSDPKMKRSLLFPRQESSEAVAAQRWLLRSLAPSNSSSEITALNCTALMRGEGVDMAGGEGSGRGVRRGGEGERGYCVNILLEHFEHLNLP